MSRKNSGKTPGILLKRCNKPGALRKLQQKLMWPSPLGATGETKFSFFGQTFESASVGIAAIFIGGDSIVILVRRSLKSIDTALKRQDEINERTEHSENNESIPAIRTNNDFHIVPSPPSALITFVPFLDDPDYTDFEFVTDQRLVDLRYWKQVPSGQEAEKISPVNWSRRLKVRKIGASDTIRVQYGSASLVDIDLMCEDHSRYRIEKSIREGFKEDEIVNICQAIIDVSDINISEEFEINIKTTFWNNFQRPREKASMSVKGKTQEISILVIFPEKKPFYEYETNTYAISEKIEKTWSGDGTVVRGQDHRRLYWRILNPPEYQGYRLWWKW